MRCSSSNSDSGNRSNSRSRKASEIKSNKQTAFRRKTRTYRIENVVEKRKQKLNKIKANNKTKRETKHKQENCRQRRATQTFINIVVIFIFLHIFFVKKVQHIDKGKSNNDNNICNPLLVRIISAKQACRVIFSHSFLHTPKQNPIGTARSSRASSDSSSYQNKDGP